MIATREGLIYKTERSPDRYAPIVTIGDTGILRIDGARQAKIDDPKFRSSVATLTYGGTSRGLNGEIIDRFVEDDTRIILRRVIENGRAWWDVDDRGGEA